MYSSGTARGCQEHSHKCVLLVSATAESFTYLSTIMAFRLRKRHGNGLDINPSTFGGPTELWTARFRGTVSTAMAEGIRGQHSTGCRTALAALSTHQALELSSGHLRQTIVIRRSGNQSRLSFGQCSELDCRMPNIYTHCRDTKRRWGRPLSH